MTIRTRPRSLSPTSLSPSDFRHDISDSRQSLLCFAVRDTPLSHTMAQVVACLDQPSTYRDSRSEVRQVSSRGLAGIAHPSLQLDRESERRLLAQSSTLYVGNLSFYTTEAQMYERKLSGGIRPLNPQCSHHARNLKTAAGSRGRRKGNARMLMPGSSWDSTETKSK